MLGKGEMLDNHMQTNSSLIANNKLVMERIENIDARIVALEHKIWELEKGLEL